MNTKNKLKDLKSAKTAKSINIIYSVMFFIIGYIAVTPIAAFNGKVGSLTSVAVQNTKSNKDIETLKTTYNEANKLMEEGTPQSLQQAINKYLEVLSVVRKNNDPNNETALLARIALSYRKLGDTEKALEYFNSILTIYKATKNSKGEAATLSTIGFTYSTTKEKQKALDYYDKAITLYKTLGDNKGLAIVLNNAGQIYSNIGNKQKALDCYNQALALFKLLGDQKAVSIANRNIETLSNTEEKQDTPSNFPTTAPSTIAKSNPLEKSNNVTSNRPSSTPTYKITEGYVEGGVVGGVMGGVMGGTGTATEPPPEPPPLPKADPPPPSIVRRSEGVIRGNALEYPSPEYPALAKTTHVEGDVVVEIIIGEDGLVANARVVNGHPLLQQAAISTAKRWKFKPTKLGNTLVKVSGVLTFKFKLNDPLPNKTLDSSLNETNIKEAEDEADKLAEQGTPQLIQKAIGKYLAILPIVQKQSDSTTEAFLLLKIGFNYDKIGERWKALNYYIQALPIFKSIGFRGLEITILSKIGQIYFDLGDKKKALDYNNQARSLNDSINDPTFNKNVENRADIPLSPTNKTNKVKQRQTPTFEAVRINEYSPPEIEIKNDTERILTFKIGTSTYKISANTSKNISISPGSFQVHVMVPSIAPLVGYKTFQTGYRYSITYRIKTTYVKR